MRTSTNPVLEAMKFETLKALKSDGYYTCDLFGIVGLPGVWRRIPKDGAKLKSSPVKVSYDGSSMVLVRDEAIEHELRCAGLGFVTPEAQQTYIEEAGHGLPGVKEPPENPNQLKIPGTVDEPGVEESESTHLLGAPEAEAAVSSPEVSLPEAVTEEHVPAVSREAAEPGEHKKPRAKRTA